MKNSDNIEKIFKEAFEHFEADVNPQAWSNVQSKLNSVSGATASSASKFMIGKIIAGVLSATVLAGSIWYFSSPKDHAPSSTIVKQHKSIVASKENIQNIPLENMPVNHNHINNNGITNGQIAPSVPFLNHSSSDNAPTSQQTQIISNTPNNAPIADASASENTGNISGKSVQHKYGRSAEESSSPIRVNQKQNPKLKSSKENAPTENQEAEPPHANILASIESGDVPLTVTFSNQGVMSALNWDFGDGSSSRENSPTHTFEKPGNYNVKLISKNSLGGSTDKITIEVRSISAIETAPNIFSPNGDGENDLFFLSLKNIASIEVVISDLNAHIVGGWNTLEGSWNGKLRNGDDAPEGLYFYTIQAIGTDGVNHSRKGSVSLSRKR